MRTWLTVLLMAGTAGLAGAGESLPDAGTVIRKFIDRAAQSLTNQPGQAFVYFRTNITEELDHHGGVSSRKERVYQVALRGRDRETRLVQVDHREPTPGEREEDAERLQRKQGRHGQQETPDRSRRVDAFINEEVLGRYVFEVERREEVEGRSALKLNFQPSPEERDADSMMERVLDRLGGAIWIDESEHELVRAEVRLLEKVRVWGGFLGVLEDVQMEILRQREASGQWRDRDVNARFTGRALTRRINVRTQDRSSAAVPLVEKPLVAAE